MQEDVSIWLLGVASICKMVRPGMLLWGIGKRLPLSLGSGPGAVSSGIQQQILRADRDLQSRERETELQYQLPFCIEPEFHRSCLTRFPAHSHTDQGV